MKRALSFLLCFIFLLLVTVPCIAHSGGTDSNGGHYDRSTGEYHYHHGKPAHQHPNGECPYEKNFSSDPPTSKSTNDPPTSKSTNLDDILTFIAIAVGGGYLLFFFVPTLLSFFNSPKN